MAGGMGRVCQPSVGANRPPGTDRPPRLQAAGRGRLPTVHMGVAATRMERRGIVTDKGNVNRQIAADNKTAERNQGPRDALYNWTKTEAAKPQGKERHGAAMAGPAGNEQTGDTHRQSESP